MRFPSATPSRGLVRGVAVSVAALVVAGATAMPAGSALADEVAAPEPTLEATTDPTTDPTTGPTAPPQVEPQVEPAAPETSEPPETTEPPETPDADRAPVLPAGPSCLGGALGTGIGSGAVSPVDGRRYVARLSARGVLRLSVVEPDGSVSAPVARVGLPGAAPDGGGIAFDAQGRLYAVAAADPADSRPGVARLYRTDTALAAQNPPATLLTETLIDAGLDAGLDPGLDRGVDRIAFDAAGYLHLADAAGSTRVNPVTGAVEQVLGAAESRALACGRPSQLTVRVDLPQGRVAPGDQFRVAVTGADYTPTGPSGLTVGRDPRLQLERPEYAQGLVVPGDTYRVALTGAGGADLPAYEVSRVCTGAAGTVLAEGAGTEAAVTVPTERFGTAAMCTFTVIPAVVQDDADAEPGRSVVPEPRVDRFVTERKNDPGGSGLGANLPAMGLGMTGNARDDGADRDRDDQDQDTEDPGAERPSPGTGLGDMTGLGDSTDPDPTTAAEDPKADDEAAGGPLDPVLPETGGPTAIAIPVGLGAVVVGSILLTRRRLG